MPEKHHAVNNEKYNYSKCKISKPNGGIRKIVNVEKAKEKEEYSRKVGDAMKTPKAGIQVRGIEKMIRATAVTNFLLTS